MTESASSRDRDEVKRVSNHITRGTLPNPISMSPVALFSPACLRSPESSRSTRFDLPSNEILVSNPRSTTAEHPLLVPPPVRSPSPSRSSHPASLLPAIRGRIERSMGPVDYQSSATFGGQSWVTSVSLTGTTFRIFAR